MQFKILALAAVAAVAVSAQAFDNNACTACVFASFDQDTECKTLPAADMTLLKSAFTPTSVDPLKISQAIQKPAVKSCLCHWASTAFTANGAAAGCTSGATPTCNSTQQGQAADGIKGLLPILNCTATTSGGSASPSATGPTSPGATKGSTGSSIQLNMPYVLSVAALGLAAIAGL